MKNAFTCVALLIISISYANAQETAVEKNNLGLSIYLHPFSTLTCLAFKCPIYLTVEVPFSLSNSLIIRPSLLKRSGSETETGSDYDILRVGSDIGFRHHLLGELNEKGEGLYIQGQIGIFYCKANYSDDYWGEWDFFSFDRRKSLWLDAMGYIGYSFKFSRMSIFIDIGFGYGTIGRARHGELYDFNVGIGIPF